MEIKRGDIKFMVIVLFVALVLVLLSSMYFSRQTIGNQDEISKLNRNSDSLTFLNKSLNDSLVKSKQSAEILKKRIDSTAAIPEKIKKQYEIRYEKIKTLSANSLSREFSIILADSNLSK
jgi:hypothetical protein